MIKIAGIKSNDKINFKEFVDFFYKIDWYPCSHDDGYAWGNNKNKQCDSKTFWI